MTKDQRLEIEWTTNMLEQAVRKMWEAERAVMEYRMKLSRQLDVATSRPEGA